MTCVTGGNAGKRCVMVWTMALASCAFAVREARKSKKAKEAKYAGASSIDIGQVLKDDDTVKSAAT